MGNGSLVQSHPSPETEPPKKGVGFGGGVLLILLALTILAMAIDSVYLVTHRDAATPSAKGSASAR